MKTFEFDSSSQPTVPRGPRVVISSKPANTTPLSIPAPASSGTQFSKRVPLLSYGKPRPFRSILKAVALIVVVVALLLGGAAAVKAWNIGGKVFVGKQSSFVSKISSLVRGPSYAAVTADSKAPLNVLLLGIGGEGHDGPYLSDTIMLAQLEPATGKVTLVSIPRDYSVQLPENMGTRKINAAFAEGYAKNKSWDEAGRWARQVVEQISGLRVDYFAVVDFSGFEKAVDEVGGVDVDVERTFTDYTFPDDGIGYLPPLTFQKGPLHLTGKKALQFARSRHAAGEEGSDFARSQRQQKVVEAVKEKLFSLNLLTDVQTVNKLFDVFASHFHTNLGPADVYQLVKQYRKTGTTVRSVTLDPDGGLVCPKILEESGAYVLTPCPGVTTQDIKDFFKNAPELSELAAEKAVVWLSGDPKSTSYKAAVKLLKKARTQYFELPPTETGPTGNTVFSVTGKTATTRFLSQSLGLTTVTTPPQGFNLNPEKVDVLIVLGASSTDTSGSLAPLQ